MDLYDSGLRSQGCRALAVLGGVLVLRWVAALFGSSPNGTAVVMCCWPLGVANGL